MLVPAALFAVWQGGAVWFGLLALLSVGLGWEWQRLCRPRMPMVVAGAFYIGVPVLCLGWLRARSGAGLGDVVFLLLVVWSSDVAAYAVGRLVGGRKLAPRISPGKTVSGAVGGLIAAALVGVVAALSEPAARIIASAAIATLLGATAQAGDLFESWVKRLVGAKDSSNLIPGHGGLLDRLDAMLAVAPVAAMIAAIDGGGTHLWL